MHNWMPYHFWQRLALNWLPIGFDWSYRWEFCHFCLATLSDLLKGQPHASIRLPQCECWIIVVLVCKRTPSTRKKTHTQKKRTSRIISSGTTCTRRPYHRLEPEDHCKSGKTRTRRIKEALLIHKQEKDGKTLSNRDKGLELSTMWLDLIWSCHQLVCSSAYSVLKLSSSQNWLNLNIHTLSLYVNNNKLYRCQAKSSTGEVVNTRI